MKAHIDLLAGDGAGGQGDVAQKILANGGRLDPGSMRPYFDKNGQAFVTVYMGHGDPNNPQSYQKVPVRYATLRRDEWKRLDQALLPYSDFRLGGYQDLVDNNLTFDLGNGMGTTVFEYHDVSDAMEAEMTMDGITKSQGDRPEYGTGYLPLPIIHADYEINARVLAASRNLGQPLDTTGAERATRKVNEKLETLFFTDTTYTYGGGTIYSYLNHPDRNQVSLTQTWDVSGKTAKEILADVISMKQAALDARHYGPFSLYVSSNYETVLDDDYDVSGQSTQTIRDRILKVNGINSVKVVDTLPDDTVLLVQMTSDVVRIVRGMGLQNVQWQTQGGLALKFKVMTIQVPQIRSDQDGHSGIVHLAA